MKRAPALAIAAACWLAVVLAGCVTTPLERREWRALRTAHYDVFSALGERETARLAIEIERFRAALVFLWGEAIPPAPVRTRIYAFDDRGIGRPFAHGPERSYLLPRLDGDVIVLRTGGGWGGDARTPLRLATARRLLWNAAPDALPPWLEEGVAQLASTVEIRGQGASVGILRDDHVAALRAEQWISFERLLAAGDLVRWTGPERALFEAEAWALCHFLRLTEERRRGGAEAFSRFRARIARGDPPFDAARGAFGDDLQHAVWRHVRAAELPSMAIRIQRTGSSPTPRTPSEREVLEELGLLALAIDEEARARRYLERALTRGPDAPRVLAGLAVLRERDGDAPGADGAFDAALARAPGDARIHLARADQLRARAERAADAAGRRALAERARVHYRRAAELAPALPAAHAGLAASHLLPGEDPAAAAAPAERARRLLPGDAAARRLGARVLLRRGERERARHEAVSLVTRARSADELASARALLEEIDSGATPP